MYGAFDIDSMPPVTMTSWSPARIIGSAISTARIEEAQTLLIVSAPTSFGIPAPIAACRAGACPTPACRTWPMITYSTSFGSSPARSSAALIAIAPSSGAWYAASPPPSFPNGVRAAETITERMKTAYRRAQALRRAPGLGPFRVAATAISFATWPPPATPNGFDGCSSSPTLPWRTLISTSSSQSC